jgi:hypothetical protein
MSNSAIVILGFASLASLQLLKYPSGCGSTGCKELASCSSNYCIDPKCVPASCPNKTVCLLDNSCGDIHLSFNAFLTTLQEQVMSSKQICNGENTFLPETALKQCSDTTLVQVQGASGTSNMSSGVYIPPGAVIYSYRLIGMNGYWWVQIIYYYNEQYYYVMYNTGIQVTRRLGSAIDQMAQLSSKMPTVEFEFLANHFARLERVSIMEWMVAPKLTSLLECLPDISQFKQINCLSTDNVASILPVA